MYLIEYDTSKLVLHRDWRFQLNVVYINGIT